jgi:hypothetical protein
VAVAGVAGVVAVVHGSEQDTAAAAAATRCWHQPSLAPALWYGDDIVAALTEEAQQRCADAPAHRQLGSAAPACWSQPSDCQWARTAVRLK